MWRTKTDEVGERMMAKLSTLGITELIELIKVSRPIDAMFMLGEILLNEDTDALRPIDTSILTWLLEDAEVLSKLREAAPAASNFKRASDCYSVVTATCVVLANARTSILDEVVAKPIHASQKAMATLLAELLARS